MAGARHTNVSLMIAQDNQIAMFMTETSNTTISENILKRNTIGIGAHSVSAIDAETNILTGNALAGITMVNSFWIYSSDEYGRRFCKWHIPRSTEPR
jgi:hypothetical protein